MNRTRMWITVGAVLGCVAAAAGQLTNPVYTDDSPVARDTLGRVADFVASGNDSEAVRELQRLLDEHGDRLVGERRDEDLFPSVRDRVHAALLAPGPVAPTQVAMLLEAIDRAMA